jgi:anti-sigma regulatory factor (Ser/Thr protein kinase)
MEMTIRIIRAEAQLCFEVREQSDIGECRRTASRLAQGRGFDEEEVGKVSIVATELATNLVHHGGGGVMLLQLLEDGAMAQLEMVAIDRGPGMRDVAECMRDGYSTAGTPGTGLGAASRLSAAFDLFSVRDKGTVVLSRVARKPQAGVRSVGASARQPIGDRLEFGAICVPLAGETACGDAWRIAEDDAMVSLLVTDGLGHGPLAAAASGTATEAFEERPFDDPVSMMQHLHQRLAGGRGAVAACAQLRPASGKLDYAGVGNISGVIVEPSRSRGMVSLNGTLGVMAPRSRQFDYDYGPDGVVVMHSDGLSARWHLADYPGLLLRHAAIIAAVLFRDCARKRDDATVLVARHRP